jgi:hypothetical protein
MLIKVELTLNILGFPKAFSERQAELFDECVGLACITARMRRKACQKKPF